MEVNIKETVKTPSGWVFGVELKPGGFKYRVTLNHDDYERLACNGQIDPEELVIWSFDFLLDREPVEQIMTDFDLSIIAKYFPDYEAEAGKFCLGFSDNQAGGL